MTRIHDAMFRSEALRQSDSQQAAAYDKRAFDLLREGLTENVLRHKSQPHMTTFADQIVWARSSVRIDVAGGWTDTPPYSLTSGGNVVNMAINLNGQPPLQVYVKPCKEPVIICRSIDLGAMERIETYDELQQYNKVGSPFSIPKAALTLAGFMPNFGVEQYQSLRQQLEAFGCGLEITLLAAIPAGSGLGTSSILAATVLAALSDFCGLGWDKNEICNRTLVLEQLLTTGAVGRTNTAVYFQASNSYRRPRDSTKTLPHVGCPKRCLPTPICVLATYFTIQALRARPKTS